MSKYLYARVLDRDTCLKMLGFGKSKHLGKAFGWLNTCYGSALMVRLAMPGTPAAGHKWASKDDISLFQHRTANLTTRRG